MSAMRRWVAAWLALLGVVLGVASADTILTRDGKKYVGSVTREIGGEWVEFTTREGRKVTLRTGDIAQHVKGDAYVPEPKAVDEEGDDAGASSPVMAEYKERLGKIQDGDAKGHFELAQWCERAGLKKTAVKEYEKTVEIDKDHEGARTALGFKKVDIQGRTEWLSEDDYRLYRAEEKFVSLNRPEDIAEAQAKYRKYVAISTDVSLEEPGRKYGDPETERNLPVRKVLSVRYRIVNRTPMTLEFQPPGRVSDQRRWTAIEPGKTVRGEWRIWAYAWKDGSRDRPRSMDFDNFARNYTQRERLFFQPKGKFLTEDLAMSLSMGYTLQGIRSGSSQLLSAKDFEDLVKLEIEVAGRGMRLPGDRTRRDDAGRTTRPAVTTSTSTREE